MSDQLVKRLRELSNAVTRADWNEFSMRIPVEKDRDADFVLLQAADKIAALEKDAARLDFLNSIGEAYGVESTIEGYRWEVSGAFRTVRDAIDSERVAVGAEATIKIETVTHPHFGDDPVTVYAIKLQKQVKP